VDGDETAGPLPVHSGLGHAGARLEPTFTAIFFAFLAVQNLMMLLTAKRQLYSTEDKD